MARRISIILRNKDLANKLRKILEYESFSQYIQKELCRMVGVEFEGKARRGKKANLRTDKTTIYLNDQAHHALNQLKERDGGFNIQFFIRKEIQERYDFLKNQGKI